MLQVVSCEAEADESHMKIPRDGAANGLTHNRSSANEKPKKAWDSGIDEFVAGGIRKETTVAASGTLKEGKTMEKKKL